MSPKRRSRMNPAPVEETVEESVETVPEAKEQISAFAPMEFFGKEVKEGDIDKVKILGVDPETKEVQFVCVSGGDYGGESKSLVDQMDEAMPEEEVI